MARDTSFAESPSGSSHRSLAERLRGGSSTAWRDLVRLYGPLVDRWCQTAQVPPDAIPDIAQEVFLAAFRGIEQYDADRPDATFRGWLWTVTRSRIVDYYRRQRNVNAARGGSSAHATLASIADPVPCEEPTEPDHAAALLHRALEQIRAEFTTKTWDLFWRSTVLDHPTDLVATEMGVAPATVRQAKSRVLRRLRQQLGDAP